MKRLLRETCVMISGKRSLIVGGGIGSMASAIRFAELGGQVSRLCSKRTGVGWFYLKVISP
jgi:heterodisulfide reductase subunit A-like polyferredoxin